MASRKEEKEQRRQARLEAEQAAASEERRKKLFAVIGATVLAAIVVVVALIVVNQSEDDSGGDASSINADIPVIPTIDALDQERLKIGDPAAKVTISEFGDLQCPVCKQFSETVIPSWSERRARSARATLSSSSRVRDHRRRVDRRGQGRASLPPSRVATGSSSRSSMRTRGSRTPAT